MTSYLQIQDLHVSIGGKQILKGLDLNIRQGEIHALMGPNGSGKSTLANTLMGHPRYKIEKGNILLNGESLLDLSPDKRARKGLFLAFQYPVTVSGLSISSFLRNAYNAVRQNEHGEKKKPPSYLEFKRELSAKLKLLEMDETFVTRYLNEGFSGGEKKRAEILQMAMLKPSIAILDETDSGLDIDALRVVADGVNKLAGQEIGIAIITHYQRILRYIQPHHVHVMVDGRIVRSGGSELARQLEEKGYGWIKDDKGET
uniref:FeS assembly ATPase (SufC) n=1 Tax=uncultured marine thaumarchaeote KM3_72_A09 TaxID=1456261 RepID=A0A075HHT6_9ARCH|nr:FeS assembly ATPase (sufC) [uncultured marine thaumarchaeote KM3_72_A09]